MSPAANPEQRKQIASIAALTRHSFTDGHAATSAARYASHVRRFEKQVDPEGVLPSAERARRVVAARKAYFRALALKSAQSRSANKNDKTS